MDTSLGRQQTYVLGSDAEELARLDLQAAAIAPATKLLLQSAGIARGMRVLDLGTGLGHVAHLAGDLVGPSGAVVGLDQSDEMLAVARARTESAGATDVSFVCGDAAQWHCGDAFDAIAGASCFSMSPIRRLRCGTSCAIYVPAVSSWRWISTSAVAEPSRRSRSQTRRSNGWMRPLPRSARGRASVPAEQMDVGTLEARLGEELRRAHAVLLPPTVVGAWGKRSAA